jgi:ABC-type glycerol-3-phosphate transport system substrate-binding protein
MKSIMLFLILILLVPSFVFSRGEEEKKVPSELKKDVITIATNLSGPDHKMAWDVVSSEYKRLFPNVEIKLDYIPPTVQELEAWLKTHFAGADPADLVQSHPMTIARDIAPLGYVVRMNEYHDKISPYTKKRWGDSFSKGSLSIAQDPKGNIWDVWFREHTTGMFYNAEMFKQAAVSPPQKDWSHLTWKEFMTAQDKIKNAGHIPFAMANKTFYKVTWIHKQIASQLWYDLVPSLDPFGPYDGVHVQEIAGGIKTGLFDLEDPKLQENYKMMHDFASKYWSPGFNGTDEDGAYQLFATGKAGTIFLGTEYIKTLRDDKLREFDFGTFNFPIITKETSIYAGGPRLTQGAITGSFVVSKKAEERGHLDRVMDFVMFLTSPETAAKWCEITWDLSGVKGVELKPEMASILANFIPSDPSVNWKAVRLVSFERMDDAFRQFWFRNLQLYLAEKMSLEEFVKLVRAEMIRTADRLAQKEGWKYEYKGKSY